MTVILGFVFILWMAIFVLSALICDDRPERSRTVEQLQDEYLEVAEHDSGDRHWLAKKQLELAATEEMLRIADPT